MLKILLICLFYVSGINGQCFSCGSNDSLLDLLPKWMTPNSRRQDKGFCNVEVKDDMKEKVPIFINENNSIATPVGDTKLYKWRQGETVKIACPGEGNHLSTSGYNDKKIITGTCVEGRTFAIDGKNYDITTFSCWEYPEPYLKNSSFCAKNEGLQIDVGFEIEGVFNEKMMEICFNPKELRTYYTTTKLESLDPEDDDSILFSSYTPPFKPDYFHGVNPNVAYQKQEDHKPSDYVDYKFQKGHHIPKGDFAITATKRMTFYYINTSPQWDKLNMGNWKSLELAVRKFSTRPNKNVRAYTGSHGTIKSDNGKSVALSSDGKMPIPMYYWKIVVDETTDKGVAFVGINDPRNTTSVCAVVCDNLTWLGSFAKARKKRTSGYVDCCSVGDFKKAFPDIALPQSLLEFKGQLLTE